jgi:hypothetical protein
MLLRPSNLRPPHLPILASSVILTTSLVILVRPFITKSFPYLYQYLPLLCQLHLHTQLLPRNVCNFLLLYSRLFILVSSISFTVNRNPGKRSVPDSQRSPSRSFHIPLYLYLTNPTRSSASPATKRVRDTSDIEQPPLPPIPTNVQIQQRKRLTRSGRNAGH